MRLVYFAHSIRSCWNNGNAHFQRGLLRELIALGHDCIAAEPADSWSRHNLIEEQGLDALSAFDVAFPDLAVTSYEGCEVEKIVDGADVVIVHEWTSPDVSARLCALRRTHRFKLVFHDTHHRAVTAAGEIDRYTFGEFDAVIAFGQCLAEVYRKRGWSRRCYVLHEAADTRIFKPPPPPVTPRRGIVWVGNWGDEERSAELEQFLLLPSMKAHLPLDIYGVRYPPDALDALRKYRASYRGWIANTSVPDVFATALATVHVPRRSYTHVLPGIPTIRVFEALACGIPLVSAPWRDEESLFTPGADFLPVSTAAEAEHAMREISHDEGLRHALAAHGIETIRRRHTCLHRARELVTILDHIGIDTGKERMPCA